MVNIAAIEQTEVHELKKDEMRREQSGKKPEVIAHLADLTQQNWD